MIEIQDPKVIDIIKDEVDFFYLLVGSPDCGYCTQLKQDMIDHEEFDETNVVFINSDKHDDFANKMYVEYVPTLFIYQNGVVVKKYDNVNDINLQTLKNTYG